MTGSVATYQSIMRNRDRSLAAMPNARVMQREIDYYEKTIGSIKTIADFVGNKRVFNFAMKAYGLEDMAFGGAFIKKLLTEGVSSKAALANRLADPRFRAFASAFNFARYGAFTTMQSAATSDAVTRYASVSLEQSVGASNEGVRLALYFQRQAPSLSSPYAVLADAALSKVVRTALGLADATAAIDIDKQAKLIGAKIDFTAFKDPAKLKTFVTNFLHRWDAAQPAAATTSPILAAGAGGASIGVDTLMSLQSARANGG